MTLKQICYQLDQQSHPVLVFIVDKLCYHAYKVLCSHFDVIKYSKKENEAIWRMLKAI